MKQKSNVAAVAQKFITDEVPTVEGCAGGARDIIAERISENERARNIVQPFSSVCHYPSKVVKGKEEEGDFPTTSHRKSPLKCARTVS